MLEEFGKVSAALAFPVFESCVGPGARHRALRHRDAAPARRAARVSRRAGGRGVDVRAAGRLGAHRPDHARRGAGRAGGADRHQALVLRRRPRGRLRRLLPHEPEHRGRRGHRRGVRGGGHAGTDASARREPDGLSRRAEQSICTSTAARCPLDNIIVPGRGLPQADGGVRPGALRQRDHGAGAGKRCARGRARLRAGAQAVRQAAGGFPGGAAAPGGNEDESRGGASADLARGVQRAGRVCRTSSSPPSPSATPTRLRAKSAGTPCS